jgi:hypothetical protein
MYFQKNRYFNAKKTGVGDKHYDSKFEANYGFELELQKNAKQIKDFRTHVKIPLDVNGYHICDYYIDFIVDHNDGITEYVETKGLPMPVWKIKWKLFEALYSEKENVKLTVVMQNNYFKIPRAKKLK